MTDFYGPVLFQMEAMATQAGKINQAEISAPVAHAAVGNMGYTDAYTALSALGWNFGTKMKDVLPGKTEYYDPIGTNTVTGEFGEARSYYKKGATHQGTDIAMAMDSPLRSAISGKVMAIENDPKGYGNYIKIANEGLGVSTLDAHANSFSVNVGDIVEAGQVIGAVGSTGRSTGPHRHHEFFLKGKRMNPRSAKEYMAGLNKDTYSITIGLSGNNKYKMVDPDIGYLKISELRKLQDVLNTAPFKDKVERIITNRPELLQDTWQYKDYSQFRGLKGKGGKPLFVKGNVDGFEIVMKKDGKNMFNKNAIPVLAEDGVRTSTDVLPSISVAQNKALLEAVKSRDVMQSASAEFGLAMLNRQEYRSYGVADDAMENPILQNRVLVQEFQRGLDILGSERKAVYAIAGGDFRNSVGEVKSWREIKEDANAIFDEWFIAPIEDATRRKKVNDTVAKYEIAYQKALRGA